MASSLCVTLAKSLTFLAQPVTGLKSSQLSVKLDGGQHAREFGKDQTRDQWFLNQGIKALRFWNNEVFSNLNGVLDKYKLKWDSNENDLVGTFT